MAGAGKRPRPILHDCLRERRLPASAEAVWEWLLVPRQVFLLNVFHIDLVGEPEPETVEQGVAVTIRHRLCLVRQDRVARVTRCEPFRLAWGEVREDGVDDFFPHSQSFELEPLDGNSCLVRNHLRGQIIVPAARLWFVPFYRRLAPRILDAENRKLARAVARS